MKRLIRKSEWYDTIKFKGGTFEIFKNPTSNEIMEIKQLNSYNSIRGIIINGTVYAWNGMLLHINMNNINIDINSGLHFSCEDSNKRGSYGGWTFDTTNLNTSLDNICTMIQDSKSILSQMGDLNRQIFIGKTSDNFGYNYEDEDEDLEQPGYFIFANWAEMDEYVKNKIIAIKNKIKLNKTASLYQTLDHFTLKSGDSISFDARILANRPWFQIVHDHRFSSSSYYDGSDFERALEMYTELLLAFKGAAMAEKVRKSRGIYEKKIQKLVQEKKDFSNNQMYDSLKRKPLFLGNNNL